MTFDEPHVYLNAGELEYLTGLSMRTRVMEDLYDAKKSLRILTADLKLARLGKSKDAADLLLGLARRGVKVQCMASGTTGRLRTALAERGSADLPGFQIKICPRNHAKALVIDESVVYVGSANLTGKGLGTMAGAGSINMEIMIRLKGEGADNLRRAILETIWEPLWNGVNCKTCLLKRKGRCDGLLDKFQILDLGPS